MAPGGGPKRAAGLPARFKATKRASEPVDAPRCTGGPVFAGAKRARGSRGSTGVQTPGAAVAPGAEGGDVAEVAPRPARKSGGARESTSGGAAQQAPSRRPRPAAAPAAAAPTKAARGKRGRGDTEKDFDALLAAEQEKVRKMDAAVRRARPTSDAASGETGAPLTAATTARSRGKGGKGGKAGKAGKGGVGGQTVLPAAPSAAAIAAAGQAWAVPLMAKARSALERMRARRERPLEPYVDFSKPLPKAKPKAKQKPAQRAPTAARLPPSAAEATAGPVATLGMLRRVAIALGKYEAELRPLLGEPTLASLAFAAETRRVLHEAYAVGAAYPAKQSDEANMMVSVLAAGSEVRRRMQRLLMSMHREPKPPEEQLRLACFWLWRALYAEFRRLNAAELPPVLVDEAADTRAAGLRTDERPVGSPVAARPHRMSHLPPAVPSLALPPMGHLTDCAPNLSRSGGRQHSWRARALHRGRLQVPSLPPAAEGAQDGQERASRGQGAAVPARVPAVRRAHRRLEAVHRGLCGRQREND